MFGQFPHAAKNIFRCVLTVGVCCHASDESRPVIQQFAECSFQCSSLSSIDVMMQNRDTILRIFLFYCVKNRLKTVTAAIIHDTDIADAYPDQ